MTHIRLLFRKEESARFLSHLDLMATLEYGMRRARLPIELSAGFTPRPRMSLGAALPLGHLGEEEVLEIELREPLVADEVVRRLGDALPPGIVLFAGWELPAGAKSAASSVHGAVYRVELPDPAPDLAARAGSLLTREHIELEEQREDGTRTRDVRPLILEIEPLGPAALRLTVRLTPDGSVRPESVLDLLGIPREGARIIRERLILD
jgi:radical SAM-linked protein